MNIRAWRSADEVACRACIVELQEAERQIEPRLRPGEEMADEFLQQAHARCREHDGAILVAEAGGAIAGLVIVLGHVPFEGLDEPPGDCAVVSDLIVRHAFRGRAIGAALLREAERHARAVGARELRIGVLSANLPARNLYLREGFAPYNETLTMTLDP